MQKITSRDNPKLKFARKVRDGREADFIFVEGVRLAEEFLKSGLKISDCFVSGDFFSNERNEKFFSQISAKTSNFFEIPNSLFGSISDTKNSQGLIIIGKKLKTDLFSIDISSNQFQKFPFVIYLKEINNPNNLGAILRTCEAVGITNVIISNNSADVFSPKSLRSAMGAAFRLNFWNEADFETVLDWSKKNNLMTICADINSGTNLWEIEWRKPHLIIFGSEAHGLTDSERKMIDENLIIPMENDVESLNLAVSCAVVLYEAKRNWI